MRRFETATENQSVQMVGTGTGPGGAGGGKQLEGKPLNTRGRKGLIAQKHTGIKTYLVFGKGSNACGR